MKKLILYLFPLVALISIFMIYKSVNLNPTEIVNSDRKPLHFKDNEIQCPQCFMYLVGEKFTAQAITSDNKTHFFDDVGCMVLWLEDNHKEDKNITRWVFSLDTKMWVKAEEAFYSIDDKTPMEYGFGAYEKSIANAINYEQMKLKMLRGENMSNPKIRQQILGK